MNMEKIIKKSSIILIVLIYCTVHSIAQNPNYYNCENCSPATIWETKHDTLNTNAGLVQNPPCNIIISYQTRECNGVKEIKVLGMSVPPCAEFLNAGDQYRFTIWGLIWRNGHSLSGLPQSNVTQTVRIYSAPCWRYAQCNNPSGRVLVPCGPPCCITTLKSVHSNSCGNYESESVETKYEGIQSLVDYCDTSFTNTNSPFFPVSNNYPCVGNVTNVTDLPGCMWTCFQFGDNKKKWVLINGFLKGI